MNTSPKKGHILPVIVFAQFAGTSLWFAGNAVVNDLQIAMNLGENVVGDLTSAVQSGFIFGTLVFALLSVADRFSPAKVFLVSTILGAFFNLAVCLFADSYFDLMSLRFLTGFFIAGIYPVGMKISADWYSEGLGKALGWLVGALVLGTAFPHLLKGFSGNLPWQNILFATSGLSIFGGLVLYFFAGDGPNRKRGSGFDWKAVFEIFKFKEFRAAAFGYFGHMWELFTFWAFVPLLLTAFDKLQNTQTNVSFWSFLIIAAGAVGCIVGGYFSEKIGSRKVAFRMLLVSGICCLISPFIFQMPQFVFLIFMLIWGFSVVGDSPQFSAIIAQTAPKKYVGTALTIVNSIGFALTIFSIQLLTFLLRSTEIIRLFPLFVIGPILGLIALKK